MHNAEVLKGANTAPMDEFIRAARFKWFGRVVKIEYPTALGSRSMVKGRPRQNWLSCVLKDAALFTGVHYIITDAVEQQTKDRLH